MIIKHHLSQKDTTRRWEGKVMQLALFVLLIISLVGRCDGQPRHRGAVPAAESKQPVQVVDEAQGPGPIEALADDTSEAPEDPTTLALTLPPKKVGRINVPNAEVTLSRIAYGSLHFPEYEDNVEALKQSLYTCLSLGITTMDLSDVYGWYKDGYGKANDIFSQVLKANPDLRPQMELVAKFGIRLDGGYRIDVSPQWITESLERYLELCDTDHIDVFMIHNPDPNMNYDDIARTFRGIKDAGKAKAFGISNFPIWQYELLRDAMAKEDLKLSVHEMETSVLHPVKITGGTVDYFSKGENELRILGWGPLGGDPNGGKNLLFDSYGDREKRIVNELEQKGKALVLEVVTGDVATEKDSSTNTIGRKQIITFQPDEVAIAWLLHAPGNIVPIIGTTMIDRIKSQSIPPQKIPFRDQDFEDIVNTLYY